MIRLNGLAAIPVSKIDMVQIVPTMPGAKIQLHVGDYRLCFCETMDTEKIEKEFKQIVELISSVANKPIHEIQVSGV